MLVDLEIPAGSTFIMLRRPDGSMTVSVERKAVEDAVLLLVQNDAAISRAVCYEGVRNEGASVQ